MWELTCFGTVLQRAQSSVELLSKDNEAPQSSRGAELLAQKDNCPPDSGPPADEGNRGSAFLVQVFEALRNLHLS